MPANLCLSQHSRSSLDTKSDVSNQVSGANIQAHVVLEPEVSNEQTANEGFDANILHAPGDEHIVSNEGSNVSILQAH